MASKRIVTSAGEDGYGATPITCLHVKKIGRPLKACPSKLPSTKKPEPILIDRAEAVVGLKVIGIKAAHRLKCLFSAGKGLDSKLCLANEAQPLTAPFEAASLFCKQAQIASAARVLCAFNILLKIPRHDHQSTPIVRFESGQ